MIGYNLGSSAAMQRNKVEVISAPKVMEGESGTSLPNEVRSKLCKHQIHGYLNFGRVSDRINDYFHAFEKLALGKRILGDSRSNSF